MINCIYTIQKVKQYSYKFNKYPITFTYTEPSNRLNKTSYLR